MKYLFIFMAFILGASESNAAEENPFSELKNTSCIVTLSKTIQLLQEQNGKAQIGGKVTEVKQADTSSNVYAVSLTDGCDWDDYQIEIGSDCSLVKIEITQSNG